MSSPGIGVSPKQQRENYLAKAAQAEANAATAEDPATKANWQKIAETYHQLAGRLR
jgi:hypothetical protein